MCYHKHSLYLFSENKHPYVARQKPPILEPSYVLNHFPDINCPMNVILKKMYESPERASSNGLEEIAAAVLVQEHVAELECLLLPPKEAFHAVVVENNYPKVLFRKKDHKASMTAEAAQYYEEKVQCANVLRLCALTKGQSKNLRFVRTTLLTAYTANMHFMYLLCFMQVASRKASAHNMLDGPHHIKIKKESRGFGEGPYATQKLHLRRDEAWYSF